MNHILCCDWLPEWARWHYLACLGLPAVSCKKNFPESHVMNPFVDQACLVKMAFCKFMDLSSVLVHKHAENELGQYPVILTKQAWSITHIYLLTNLNPYLELW